MRVGRDRVARLVPDLVERCFGIDGRGRSFGQEDFLVLSLVEDISLGMPQVIGDSLRDTKTPLQSVRKLVAKAFGAGARDNISLIVARRSDAPSVP